MTGQALPPFSKNICGAFDSGQFNFARSWIRRQLEFEGDKRLAAFSFESLFKENLVGELGADACSFGWILASDARSGEWFKLQTTAWSKADDAAAMYLARRGATVRVTRFDPQSDASDFSVAVFPSEDQEPLRAYLTRLFGPAGDYPVVDHRAVGLHAAALDRLVGSLNDEQLVELSLSRLLILCRFYRWFGRQPMDLDAICLVEDRPRFIEFKRKYPARSGEFGIDDFPHGELIRWLNDDDEALWHIVLTDPLEDKHRSPLHLLEPGSVTAEFATCLGAALGAGSLAPGHSFKTQGSDSGQNPMERSQLRISNRAWHELGVGISGWRLRQFLEDLENCPPVAEGALRARKAAAGAAIAAEWPDIDRQRSRRPQP